MSEIEILNKMAERAVDHWTDGELYKSSKTVRGSDGVSMQGQESITEEGNCLGLVGYAVWGEAYNAFCQNHTPRGPLKKFLKNHKLTADCLDGYDLLLQDPDAQAVITRLAALIRAGGSVVDEDGFEWEWVSIIDHELVYGYNDAMGKDRVIDLIDKAISEVGGRGL